MHHKKILEKIEEVTSKISSSQFEKFIEVISKAKRIYVVGEGRSGLMARAFAMRLVHLGKESFVVGETVTPAMRKNDVLLVVSGSGETKTVVETAKVAKKIGSVLVIVTASPRSKLGKIADHIVYLPAKIKKPKEQRYGARELMGLSTITPLGSLFEISVLVFFESTVIELMRRLKISEAKMKKIHANL